MTTTAILNPAEWIPRIRPLLDANWDETGFDFPFNPDAAMYQRLFEAGDSSKRTIAKPGVLGCGYMLGAGEERINHKTGEKEATGLLGYAWNMQVTEFTQEQSKLSVETFRREFEEVKDYWYGIERAAKKCIRTGKRVDFGRVYFDRKGPFMRMGLPSGRHLHYCRPRIEEVMMPWGEKKASITYESQNDRKQWVRESTHPGKLTENADQAIARDLLAHGMKLADRRGLALFRLSAFSGHPGDDGRRQGKGPALHRRTDHRQHRRGGACVLGQDLAGLLAQAAHVAVDRGLLGDVLGVVDGGEPVLR